jgi:5-exo-hydroxycamphor dehydrogenase
MHLAVELEKRVPLAEIITRRVDVADVDTALDAVQDGLAVKAVISPTRIDS